MSFSDQNYAPPGVYTQTRFESPVQGLLQGLRLPILIGTGSEILSQNSLEVVRGSSASVDQRIVQEDLDGRAVVSVSPAGAVTLGDFDGENRRVQVRKYPIVTGDGTGTTATRASAVSVTVNNNPIVVIAIDGANGILELSTPPKAGDVVRVTYFFKRTDTLIVDDVTNEVTGEAAVLYGAIGQAYDIDEGVNDTLDLWVDDATRVEVVIPPSGPLGWSANQIAAFINAAGATTSLQATTFFNNFGEVAVLLTAARNLEVLSGSSASTLGFSVGQRTTRNRVFHTFQGPIVDGTNGGVTTTDPSDVVVKVNGVQVIPTAVDGAHRAVTLPFAPEAGAQVTIQYFFNAWQDTYDYLAHIGVTEVRNCGVSPGRRDFVEGVDFVLKDDRIIWGTSVLVTAGENTQGTTLLNESQVIPTLVDTRAYMEECQAVLDTSVSPARESRTEFVLPLEPTTGNGRNSLLGSSLFQTVSNGRIDLPTNRPDLVAVSWGYGVQDALDRGVVAVLKVDSSTSTVTLKESVPVGAQVYASFYYNTLVDQKYTIRVDVPGASGVGRYTVLNEAGEVLLTPQFGSKSSGLTGITVQFPSGSERRADFRFESPFVSGHFKGPVAEDVTVTFESLDSTPARFATEGAAPYEFVQGASDRLRIQVDNADLASGAAGLDLSQVNGIDGLGFAATMVGAEVEYDADTGHTTYPIDATNDGINLTIDGVLVQANAAPNPTGTLDDFVTAINAAATATPPRFPSAGRFLSAVTITPGAYDTLAFHYTGDVSTLSGNLVVTIASGTYNSVATLATAIEAAVAAEIATLGGAFAGLDVGVSASSDGNLVFELTRATGDSSGYLEFVEAPDRAATASLTVDVTPIAPGETVTIDGVVLTAVAGPRTPGSDDFDGSLGTPDLIAADIAAAINDPANSFDAFVTATDAGAVVSLTAVTPGAASNAITLATSSADITLSGATFSGGSDAGANDFAVLAGIDTDAASSGAQTKLVDGPIARRYTLVGDMTGALQLDRLVLRNRLIPGFGTVAPFATLSRALLRVEGGTGDTLTGLEANTSVRAGWKATVTPATLLGLVGFANGQVPPGTYGDARDGQPVVTFHAAGGTLPQNNVFKFTFDGVPITLTFTDDAGATIPTAGSADVPLGPATEPNTVLSQIRAALTAAGFSGADACVQEGAAIRLLSQLQSTESSIVIGNGNANGTLGFSEGQVAERSLVEADTLASALMADVGPTVSSTLNGWDAPTVGHFAEQALASVVSDDAGARHLYLQSLSVGFSSAITFAAASVASALLPFAGLTVMPGDGATGEAGMSGFYVLSTDNADGSGTVNNSILNPSNTGEGQDGVIGQTYRDQVTGLTFTVLPRAGGAPYPSGSSFTIRVRESVKTDSNLPVNTIPGVELVVTNTFGVGAGDTAIVETIQRGGAEPSIGDLYYVSYNYRKQDFQTRLFTKQSTVEAQFGELSPDNPVSLASYLAILNGAVVVGIKQVQKDSTDGRTASVPAFRDAVDELEGPLTGGILPDILVPLRGDSSDLFSYMTRHADIQSDIRHRAERTVIAGVASGTQPRTAGDIAQSIQRTRFRLVYPDVMIVPLPRADGPDEETLVDGTYLASMLAGSVVSPNTDVATPWTNRRLIGASRLARVLDAVEQNQVGVRGVTVIEDRPPVLRVRHGVTSDLTSVMTRVPTVIQIVDETQKQTRQTLERFIGHKFLPGILSQIEGQLANTLRLLVNAQILAAYTGVKANISPDDPTTAEVEAYIQPVWPLLYVVVTFNLRANL